MSQARAILQVNQPGDVLSPSQAKTFLSCSAKWYFKYVCRRPDPPTGALTVGSAIHEALGQNFAQKLETRKDLPPAGLVAIYRSSWQSLQTETEFREDEDPSDLSRQGEQLALKYLEEAAPHIEPAAVEIPVSGNIGGVPVRGFIDLLDVNGCVIDIKSKAQKPSKVEFDHKFQVATYRKLEPGASGAGRVDTLVKTAKPQLVQLPFQVSAADLTMTEMLYPAVQQAIRAEQFLPNRGSNLCSRKYCSFWRACQNTFGGEVAE
jgi:CRISPR/Cas system-associated exonuclease Cas4 (RecB family)